MTLFNTVSYVIHFENKNEISKSIFANGKWFVEISNLYFFCINVEAVELIDQYHHCVFNLKTCFCWRNCYEKDNKPEIVALSWN